MMQAQTELIDDYLTLEQFKRSNSKDLEDCIIKNHLDSIELLSKLKEKNKDTYIRKEYQQMFEKAYKNYFISAQLVHDVKPMKHSNLIEFAALANSISLPVDAYISLRKTNPQIEKEGTLVEVPTVKTNKKSKAYTFSLIVVAICLVLAGVFGTIVIIPVNILMDKLTATICLINAIILLLTIGYEGIYKELKI